MIAKATLFEGQTVEYLESANPPFGAMKQTYFSPDRTQVVQFYHPELAVERTNRLERLKAIVWKHNLTLPEYAGGATGLTQSTARYFKNLFCWPTGIVTEPRLGIVAPAYPSNFYFASGPFQGAEKELLWFCRKSLRSKLPAAEKGDWLRYVQMAILLARAVRRLHQANLVHCDLSSQNILIDPVIGRCMVLDVDSIVVADQFPPDVLGTPSYMAPELIGASASPHKQPLTILPNFSTDAHSLAVLIYELLLWRHPLIGPKVHSTISSEEDDFLALGPQALFIENPHDTSNRPQDLEVGVSALGPHLSHLMEQFFVTGLHQPALRPTAIHLEAGLLNAWDHLHPCPNENCHHRWFIVNPQEKPRCPFCGATVFRWVPILEFFSEPLSKQLVPTRSLVVYPELRLFEWHARSSIRPTEDADRTPLGRFLCMENQWFLVNEGFDSMASPGGNPVQPGQAIHLVPGAAFRLNTTPDGWFIRVRSEPIAK
ncbi:MAG: serine/threonine protein kinase [Acidobacteria bacterium]|nr:serine/threonine protein kinase [Acidobacteriota bacterium]